MQEVVKNLNAKIIEWVCENTRDCKVSDVIIGLAYTKVTLADMRSGLSFTFARQSSRGCCPLGDSAPLAGRNALDLVSGLSSENQLERSVALATINALRNDEFKGEGECDALSTGIVRSSDRVAMVGYFGPLVAPLQSQCRELHVFDKDISKAKMLSPLADMPEIVQQCDVVFVTSTSIADNSAEEVLSAASDCRELVLLGASTPLIPKFFQDFNVTMLSGVIVKDDASLARAVKEGRGMRSFKKYLKKVNVTTH